MFLFGTFISCPKVLCGCLLMDRNNTSYVMKILQSLGRDEMQYRLNEAEVRAVRIKAVHASTCSGQL